jgi:ribosomal-protein-alanine N-acetyltransferase
MMGMKETPILKTERLTLRPFTLDDVSNVYSWCGSLSTTQYLFWHPHRDESVSQRLVESWIRKKRNYSWAIDDGTGAIGEIQVIKDLPDQGFEIGYILREQSWHQGFMKEALLAVLPYLFVHDNYAYSYEETDERNSASRHLLESVGYRFLSLKNDVYIAKKDVTINEATYRLDKADFLKREK